jgi:hypothetical protein
VPIEKTPVRRETSTFPIIFTVEKKASFTEGLKRQNFDELYTTPRFDSGAKFNSPYIKSSSQKNLLLFTNSSPEVFSEEKKLSPSMQVSFKIKANLMKHPIEPP